MLESLNSIVNRIQTIQTKIRAFSQFGVHTKGAQFEKMLQENIQTKSQSIASIVDEKAKKFGLDSKLLHSVIKVESNYKPDAVSPKGAKGLMQLMPETAKSLGVKNSFDPEQNIEGGARYLKKLLKKYDNNVDMALAAYNAGPAVVDAYGKIPDYPETQNYVQKVVSLYKKKQGIQ